MNEEEHVFIVELEAMQGNTRVHDHWVLHAWACTGACEAQNLVQMQAEMNMRWIGRVAWSELACVMNFNMLCIIMPKTSPLRKCHLPNPNMIM